tara:strand:+ start:27 stop:845 length:819 start_codon:yes stop_codon:yes gene_type:complete
MLGLGNSITGGAALSGFAPADFGSLDIHYDFSTLTGNDGDAVASFANAGEGGSNYNLSHSNAVQQPQVSTDEMNLNSLHFDGDDRMQMANTYLTTDKTFTFFCVFTSDNMATDTFFAGNDAGNDQIGIFNNQNVTTRFNSNAGASHNSALYIKTSTTTGDEYDPDGDGSFNNSDITTTAFTFSASTNHVYVITRDASNTVKIFNENQDLIGVGTSKTNGHADTNFEVEYIGSFSNGSSSAQGTIGEIGLYNKTLSDSEAQTLAGYLATKWGA